MGRFSVARACCNPATLCYISECGNEFEVPFQRAPFEHEFPRRNLGFGSFETTTLYVESDNLNFGRVSTQLGSRPDRIRPEDVIRKTCGCVDERTNLRYDFGTNYQPVEVSGQQFRPAQTSGLRGRGPFYHAQGGAEPWQVGSFRVVTNVTLSAIDFPIPRTALTSPIDTNIAVTLSTIVRFSDVRSFSLFSGGRSASAGGVEIIASGSTKRLSLGGYDGSDNAVRNISITEDVVVTTTLIPGTEIVERVAQGTHTASAANGYVGSETVSGTIYDRRFIRRCNRYGAGQGVLLNRDHDEIAEGLSVSIVVTPVGDGVDRPSPACEFEPEDPNRPNGASNHPPFVTPPSGGFIGPPPSAAVDFGYTPDNNVAVIDAGFLLSLVPAFPGGETGFVDFVGFEGELPEGLSIDPGTGEISGTTTEIIAGTVHVQATNAAGEFATGSFSYQVIGDEIIGEFGYGELIGEVDQIGIWSPVIPTDLGAVEDYHDFQVVGLAGLPPGLEIDPRTGNISGEPTEAGTTAVRITARHVGTEDLITADAFLEIVAAGDPPPNNTREFWWGSESTSVITTCSGATNSLTIPASSDLDLAQYQNYVADPSIADVQIDNATGQITIQRNNTSESFVRLDFTADHVSDGSQITTYLFVRFIFCANPAEESSSNAQGGTGI